MNEEMRPQLTILRIRLVPVLRLQYLSLIHKRPMIAEYTFVNGKRRWGRTRRKVSGHRAALASLASRREFCGLT